MAEQHRIAHRAEERCADDDPRQRQGGRVAGIDTGSDQRDEAEARARSRRASRELRRALALRRTIDTTSATVVATTMSPVNTSRTGTGSKITPTTIDPIAKMA